MPIGITDAAGNPYFRGTVADPAPANENLGLGGGGSGSGGGEVKPLWSLDIPRDVQIAKWGLLTLFTAFGFSFLFFVGEFKDVRKDIASIQVSVAAQGATTTAIQATLTRIEDKLDHRNDYTEAGAGQRKAGAVRERAGGEERR